jgi:GT2 family glycosyltransferase
MSIFGLGQRTVGEIMIEQIENRSTELREERPNPREEVAPMAGTKDLSILIVNWNSKDYLQECLASIYRETLGLDFEVIVVDNASWDGSAEMVAAEFPEVRFIQSEKNLGFARANNLAFEHSAGRVILLLNPDTEIIGDAIPAMLKVLEETPDAGIVGCKQMSESLAVHTQSVKRFPSMLQDILGMEWLRRAWPNCKLWSIDILFNQYNEPVQVDAVCGACQLIPREVYLAVGGLSTKYFMYAEDVEISAAALSKGWKTYYAGNAGIIHHGGRSSHSAGRGDRWISVMQAEAIYRFYQTWRGKWYARLFRAVLGITSILWLVAATTLWPLLFLIGKKNVAIRVWQRRSGALQWCLGLEDFSRKFRDNTLSTAKDATNVSD